MRQEFAETVALRGLTWIASEGDLLPAFMEQTGSGADDLRARVGDPDFLVSVLDFLMLSDDRVIAFCDAHGLDYHIPMEARRTLPGGLERSWT